MRFLAFLLAATLVLASAPAEAADDLRVHVLDCGQMNGMETEPFLPDVADRPERMDLPNRCFLVLHPQGTLLWDAGLPDSFKAHALSWYLWITSLGKARVELGERLVDQLAALGMEPADIDYLALSHSHFDHAGQAGDFRGSTWLVQKAERDWVFDPELDNDNIQVDLLEPLRDAKAIPLDGDHDVFGDGRVQILSAPGHTPGHQCLYLDLAETGPVVLSGDLYHSLLNRERRVPPSFNTDRDRTRQSMDRIEAIVAERGATLWIQHAPQSGPLAPALAR